MPAKLVVPPPPSDGSLALPARRNACTRSSAAYAMQLSTHSRFPWRASGSDDAVCLARASVSTDGAFLSVACDVVRNVVTSALLIHWRVCVNMYLCMLGH